MRRVWTILAPMILAPASILSPAVVLSAAIILNPGLASFVLAEDRPSADTKPDVNAKTEVDSESLSPAGSAMETIFSPARSPKQKTMGLLQRSFLDLADQGQQELEVAIVVDGTDSMATELAGVRRTIHQMLEDLRRYRKSEVRAAIVVYRDAGSPSGEVVIPLRKFTKDPSEIARAVESLNPESGAPFFHELPDLGLHRALTELRWSDDDQVTKWILMFGDAPPYAESYSNAQTPEAYRRYATSILVSIAKQKNIRINCVLCTSSDAVTKPYNAAIDQTRSFMNALASGTDGLMLDLSYEAIRTAMIDAANQPENALTKIDPITAIDLAAVRREPNYNGSVTQVKLAVLPHLPLDRTSFDPRHPAVLVATALRNQLSRIPGVRVASPRDVKEQLRRLRSEGLADDQAMRGLAVRLGVDFVVWGSLEPDKATVRTAAYRRESGRPVIPIKLAKNSDDIAYALIQASSKTASDDKALDFLFTNMQKLRTSLNAPMAESTATHDEILTALEALDQALGYETGSEQAASLLATADRASRAAIVAEPTNAMAHWLQSNVAYNQAAGLFRSGEKASAATRMNDMRAALGEAVKHRKDILSPSLITEIEADYYLLTQRQTEKAIERYATLTQLDQPSSSQLRGHWMMAGIRAGDWGVAGQVAVNPDEARRHITEILANWPDSPEAALLKTWLRWDDTKQMTEFDYLPAIHAF